MMEFIHAYQTCADRHICTGSEAED